MRPQKFIYGLNISSNFLWYATACWTLIDNYSHNFQVSFNPTSIFVYDLTCVLIIAEVEKITMHETATKIFLKLNWNWGNECSFYEWKCKFRKVFQMPFTLKLRYRQIDTFVLLLRIGSMNSKLWWTLLCLSILLLFIKSRRIMCCCDSFHHTYFHTLFK